MQLQSKNKLLSQAPVVERCLAPCDIVEIGMIPFASACSKFVPQMISQLLQIGAKLEPFSYEALVRTLQTSLTQMDNGMVHMPKSLESLLDIPTFPDIVKQWELKARTFSKLHKGNGT